MRTAKRLAQALLVRFAGMVCPVGAIPAAAYLFRTVRRPAGAFPVRCRVGRLFRAEWLWLRGERWLKGMNRPTGDLVRMGCWADSSGSRVAHSVGRFSPEWAGASLGGGWIPVAVQRARVTPPAQRQPAGSPGCERGGVARARGFSLPLPRGSGTRPKWATVAFWRKRDKWAQPASRSTIASEFSGPGQCSRTIGSPPPRTKLRRTSATITTSSS